MNRISKKNVRNIRITVLFFVFSLVLNWGYKLYMISGDSMSPSVDSSDLVWVSKVKADVDDISRGDVVVFWDLKDGDFLLKRVIGVPGDAIKVVDGRIILNGVVYEDEFSEQRLGVMLVNPDGEPLRSWTTGEIVYEYDNIDYGFLQEDEFWVIGDNRTESWYGVVSREEILGVSSVD